MRDFRIVVSVKCGKVRVRIRKGALRDKVFIAGFHGIGYVGYLTVRHIVRAMESRLVGYVLSPYMPQYTCTGPYGITTPYELYAIRDYAVVFLPNLPLSRRDLFTVPYLLAESSLKGGARTALLIGGLDNNFKRDNLAYRYAATGAFLRTHTALFEDSKPLDEGLYIVGPLAAMMAYYQAHEFPAAAILPYADSGGADPLAAREAVKIVARVLGFGIDDSDLLRLAEEKAKLERELEEVRRKAERVRKGASALYV